MQDYFGYDVLFCMNVTDIDDKVRLFSRLPCLIFASQIIKRARERYLVQRYIDDSSIPLEKVLEDCQSALQVPVSQHPNDRTDSSLLLLARERRSLSRNRQGQTSHVRPTDFRRGEFASNDCHCDRR